MRGVSAIQCRLCLSLCALLSLAVVGCSVTSRQASQPLDKSLLIHVERMAGVPAGQIVFKPIPGRLRGKAEDVLLFQSTTGADRFKVPVMHLASELQERAATASSDSVNPGELVEPRELRIARVATFFEPAGNPGGCHNFRTGLRAAWPAQATLVYVDRAGGVRGTRYSAPYIMEYELEFPTAGLYAIRTVARGNRITQTVANPESLVARVLPAACSQSLAARPAAG